MEYNTIPSIVSLVPCTAVNTSVLPLNEDYNYKTSECNEDKEKLFVKLIPHITNLRFVDLSHNDITHIPSNSFQTVIKNGSVILRNNKIQSVNPLELRILSLLDLSNNLITDLDDIKLNGQIESLSLENNEIKNWKSNEIFNSKSLQIKNVNLSYNEIYVFDKSMLESLSSLESVDIGGNPFDCNDCSLYDLQLWLTKKKKTVVTNFGKPYTTLQCNTPANLNGKLVFNASLNPACEEHEGLIAGLTIPLPLLLIIFSILIYIFRFQVAYMIQMIKTRKRTKKGKNTNKNFEYDAFVSYGSSDRTWVHDELMKTLENDENKYALCLHERDFRLGAYIIDNVAECIDCSRKWCQWELKLVQQLMFENNTEFLILVELERLHQDDLPSTLRLLMSTRTYLECPRLGADMTSFWTRLKLGLGQPLAVTQPPCNDERELESCAIDSKSEILPANDQRNTTCDTTV
ncbi:hypothetical protein B566_EDAN010048 [Ephemera danica]|nr:hypothetical protein B566_EDAN010048 [Ephemera danica]